MERGAFVKNCVNKMPFHYISSPKKGENKKKLWGGGRSWSTVHCARYEKENSSSRFLGDVPRKSWRGGLRENCVNIMSRCCFIRLSRRSALARSAIQKKYLLSYRVA